MTNPSEAAVLAALRRTTLAYLSDLDFKEVEKAVERDGILSLQGSYAKIVKSAVEKHGSHNQSSHGGKGGGGKGGGGGGGGSASSSTGTPPSKMPFRPTGRDKLDEALFSRLDRTESNASYAKGWKEGQASSGDDKLFSAANSWIDMTSKSLDEGGNPSDGFLLETARAIGIVNGMLQAKKD